MIIGKTTDRCNICGKNVRRLREQKKMSQDQLAARLQTEGLGISRGSLVKGYRHYVKVQSGFRSFFLIETSES